VAGVLVEVAVGLGWLDRRRGLVGEAKTVMQATGAGFGEPACSRVRVSTVRFGRGRFCTPSAPAAK
jgi:hypothetical protein